MIIYYSSERRATIIAAISRRPRRSSDCKGSNNFEEKSQDQT